MNQLGFILHTTKNLAVTNATAIAVDKNNGGGAVRDARVGRRFDVSDESHMFIDADGGRVN
ncbi:hypothetical protein [Pararobbsia alpina]|uniref:Uncharacterized protein n=1 Tax=Pararobbsia alpina TaxID=621374 RepID=A0A6S7BNF4_9BURK|nr:hypothetical protein [Pararobbsia alpina]CAB3807001.1 hypothetical protein LMG28138_05873 [Pararobbsia alpina]